MNIELHITVEDASANAVDVLAEASGLSKQKLKLIMQRGAVWLTRAGHTQRLRRAKKALQLGDEVHLYHDVDVFEQQPPAATLIADEGEYSVWHKPYGMLSQGTKWGDHTCITRWAEQSLQPQRNAFIVHRLDRAATGLIMLAHTKKAASSLSALFEQRKIDKHYQAIVEGQWLEDKRIEQDVDDKPAVSHVSVLEYDSEQDRTRVEVKIETGRKHQIRKHLSGAGFPIVGDRLYGNAETARDGGTTDNAGAVVACRLAEVDLQLCSVFLGFVCPVSGESREYVLTEGLRPSL